MLSGTRRPAVFGAAAPDASSLPDAPKTSSVADAQRAFAVKLVFAIFVFSLVEGPLRKWVAPGLATPLYFLRDPLVLFLYAYCLQRRLVMFDAWTKLWLGFATLASAVGVIPFLIEGIDLRAWAFGVRSYWLYMPMAFVIFSTFKRSDALRFFRWNLLIAVPYALLVVYQSRSSRSSWINKGIAADEIAAGVVADIVRPYGLFTFTGQHVYFVAFLVACFLSYIFTVERLKYRYLLIALSAFPIASLAVLTGSRAIYFLILAIIVCSFFGSTFANLNLKTLKNNGLILMMIIFSGWLLTNVFSEMFQAMQVRVEHTASSEGHISNRALDMAFGFFGQIDNVPLLGFGIGAGAPAVTSFFGSQQFPYGEWDTLRNLNELGIIFGSIMIIMRFAFACSLVLFAWKAARRGDMQALPFAGLAGIQLAASQITNSALNAFLPWFAVGLALALARSMSIVRTKPCGRSMGDEQPAVGGFLRGADSKRRPLF